MPRLALLIGATALVAPLTAQDFTWSGRLTPGQTLEIRGVSGAVSAVLASGPEAQVTGRKREGHRGDPAEVQIVAVPHSGGMLICAVYPDNDPAEVCRPGEGGRHRVRDNDTQVEFRIEVPAGVLLTARTVNGDVDIRDLRSDVDAHTVNGDLYVATSGLAQGSTVNGSVRVRMGRADWTGEAEFSTVNGSVTLELPGDVATAFRAETVNGDIESDFPITIQGRFSPRRASGTIGSATAGRTLLLKTVNGSIELRRT